MLVTYLEPILFIFIQKIKINEILRDNLVLKGFMLDFYLSLLSIIYVGLRYDR